MAWKEMVSDFYFIVNSFGHKLRLRISYIRFLSDCWGVLESVPRG